MKEQLDIKKEKKGTKTMGAAILHNNGKAIILRYTDKM